MNTMLAPRVHPAGEGVFEFPTACGKVRLQSTADVLTPYGGLVPWAVFARHTGIFKRLAETCPVQRTSAAARASGLTVQQLLLQLDALETLAAQAEAPVQHVSYERTAPTPRPPAGEAFAKLPVQESACGGEGPARSLRPHRRGTHLRDRDHPAEGLQTRVRASEVLAQPTAHSRRCWRPRRPGR